jgi:hypothetical protein
VAGLASRLVTISTPAGAGQREVSAGVGTSASARAAAAKSRSSPSHATLAVLFWHLLTREQDYAFQRR